MSESVESASRQSTERSELYNLKTVDDQTWKWHKGVINSLWLRLYLSRGKEESCFDGRAC